MGQVGGSALNGIIGFNAAGQAGEQQEKAGYQGLGVEQGIQAENEQNYSPYLQAGKAAESNLSSMVGPNGSLGRQFTLADYQKDPSYNFDLQQGLQAIQNSNSVRGGALSGGTLKGLASYAENQANNSYQGAYNRFTQNQNQNFSQLAALANQGLGATQSLGQLGQANANAQMGQYNGIGNVQAGATLGKAQAIEGAITGATQGAAGNAQGAAALGSMFSS